MTASGDLFIDIAGEPVVLLPERALWWPAASTLIVADVHFGKSSVFRTHGFAVPGGSTGDNLARLNACLARYPAERLLCLGDLTHARSAHTSQLAAKLAAFRALHADLRIELVGGNHDRHAGVPAALDVRELAEPYDEGPFSFWHEVPRHDHGSGHVMAGHLHPAIVLSSQHDRLRVPCFVVGERATILPAFGAFTGMYNVDMLPGVRHYPALDDRVLGPIVGARASQ